MPRDSAPCLVGRYVSAEIDVTFSGRETWAEPAVDIQRLSILGVDVEPRDLPADLLLAVLDLADLIPEWEGEG